MQVEKRGRHFRLTADRRTITAIRWALYRTHRAVLNGVEPNDRFRNVRLLTLVDEIQAELSRDDERAKRRANEQTVLQDLLKLLGRRDHDRRTLQDLRNFLLDAEWKAGEPGRRAAKARRAAKRARAKAKKRR